jgi:hypothetical protein
LKRKIGRNIRYARVVYNRIEEVMFGHVCVCQTLASVFVVENHPFEVFGFVRFLGSEISQSDLNG